MSIPLANNIKNVYAGGEERDYHERYEDVLDASTTVIQMEKITHLIMIEIENVRTKGSTNRSFLDIFRHSSSTINSGNAVGR